MAQEYLPELGGAYLEDSHFLGLTAEGGDLCLNLEVALTTEHPAYEPPLTGEQHCYRTGMLVFVRPSVIDLSSVQLNKSAVTLDLDGTFDLGSVELYRVAPRRFRAITEWFDMLADVERLELRIDSSVSITA